MKINFDTVYIFVLVVIGIFFLINGIKDVKVKEKKPAGILCMFLAICIFGLIPLEIFKSILKNHLATTEILSKIQIFVAGMILGIYIALEILQRRNLLEKTREVLGKDLENLDLK